MLSFVVRGAIENASTLKKLCRNNKYGSKEVQTGKARSSLPSKVKISDARKNQFPDGCMKCLIATVNILKEQHPFNLDLIASNRVEASIVDKANLHYSDVWPSPNSFKGEV